MADPHDDSAKARKARRARHRSEEGNPSSPVDGAIDAGNASPVNAMTGKSGKAIGMGAKGGAKAAEHLGKLDAAKASKVGPAADAVKVAAEASKAAAQVRDKGRQASEQGLTGNKAQDNGSAKKREKDAAKAGKQQGKKDGKKVGKEAGKAIGGEAGKRAGQSAASPTGPVGAFAAGVAGKQLGKVAGTVPGRLVGKRLGKHVGKHIAKREHRKLEEARTGKKQQSSGGKAVKRSVIAGFLLIFMPWFAMMLGVTAVAGAATYVVLGNKLGQMVSGVACTADGLLGDKSAACKARDEIMAALEKNPGLKEKIEDLVGEDVRFNLDCTNVPADERARGNCIENLLAQPEDNLAPIPERAAWLLPIYKKAADKYNMPWELLASVHGARTNFGVRNCYDDDRKEKGYYRFPEELLSGQIRTRNPLAVDAGYASTLRKLTGKKCFTTSPPVKMNPNGNANPYDAVDAIFTEARVLQYAGAKGKEWNYKGSTLESIGFSGSDGPVYLPPNIGSGNMCAGINPQWQGLLTTGQLAFISAVSQQSGINSLFIAAWVFNEMNGSYATTRERASNHNWLNIAYYDSGAGTITRDRVWKNPQSAARATVDFFRGRRFGPSPGIKKAMQQIMADKGQNLRADFAILGKSGWASGQYKDDKGGGPGSSLLAIANGVLGGKGGSCSGSSSDAGGSDAAKPTIIDKPIPFNQDRKNRTARYSQKRYGTKTWKLTNPQAIVEHYTQTSNFQSTFDIFAPTTTSDYPDVNTCSHFIVDKNGKIYQIVPTSIRCRHTVGMNYTAIGIENVGSSDKAILNNSKQLRASRQLTNWLMCKYDISKSNVIGHQGANNSPLFKDKTGKKNDHNDMGASAMRTYRSGLDDCGSSPTSPSRTAPSTPSNSSGSYKTVPVSGGKSLGKFEATAYGPPWGGIEGGTAGQRCSPTSTGVKLCKDEQKLAIAVDPSVVPYGTKVKISPNPFNDPNAVFTAVDTGGAIKGKKVDIFIASGRKEQNDWGRRGVTVYEVGKGSPKDVAMLGTSGSTDTGLASLPFTKTCQYKGKRQTDPISKAVAFRVPGEVHSRCYVGVVNSWYEAIVANPEPGGSGSLEAGSDVRNAIVRIAKEEARLGLTEAPPGSNAGPPVRRYKFPAGLPWCAYFTSWVWQQAGVNIPTYPSVAQFETWGKQKKLWKAGATNNPQPGDVAIIGAGHIEIVVEVISPTKLVLVGGNTSHKVLKHTVDPRAYGITGYTSPPGPSGGNVQLAWPGKGAVVSEFQGNRCLRGLCRPHEGIDISVPTNYPVKSAADGVVVLASEVSGYGNYICVYHEKAKVTTCYAHNSRLRARTGQTVRQGQVIAAAGCTGRCYGVHIHFEVRDGKGPNGKPQDPRKYLPKEQPAA